MAETDQIVSGGVTRFTSGTVSGILATPLQAGQTVQIFSNGVNLGNATVKGTSWTFSDTIAASGESYTAKVVNADGSAVTASNSYLVNPTAGSTPHLTISDDAAGTAGSSTSVNFTFAFDQAVTDFTASDIVVTNGGVKGPLTQLDSKTWVMSVNTPGTGAGDMTVAVADGSFTATTGGANGVGHSDTQAFDASATPYVFNQFGIAGEAAPLTTGPANDNVTAVGNSKPELISLQGGNDNLEFYAANVSKLILSTGNDIFDGGAGVDRLSLYSSGVTLDLTNVNMAKNLKNFESIDITGTGNNVIKLGLNEVLNMSDIADNLATSGVDEGKMLVVSGNAGDTTQLSGGINWATVLSGQTAANLSSTYGSGYGFVTGHTYTQYGYNGATLFLDELMTKINV